MIELRDERDQQDFVTNKLLLVFTMVFVGIFITMYMHKIANNSGEGFMRVLSIITYTFYTSVGLTIISGITWFAKRKVVPRNPYKLITPKHICYTSLVVVLCSGILETLSIYSATKYIYVILSAIAVQYFVLVNYKKDIYFMTITSFVNLFLLNFVGNNNQSRTIFFTVLAFVFLAIFSIFAKILQKKDGMIKKYVVFPSDTNYKLITINTTILIAITIASFGFSFLGYSVGLILGGIYLVVVIFYNTLKLL